MASIQNATVFSFFSLLFLSLSFSVPLNDFPIPIIMNDPGNYLWIRTPFWIITLLSPVQMI